MRLTDWINPALSIPSSLIAGDRLLRRAYDQQRSGRLSDAENSYRAILRLQPRNGTAHYLYGCLLFCTNPENAIPHFLLAVDLDEKQLLYWLAYIESLIHIGHRDAARDAISRCQVRFPHCSALDQLALKIEQPSDERQHALIDLFKEGDAINTELSARIFLNEYPHNPLGWNILAQVLISNHQHDEALSLLRDYIRLTPKSVAARVMLAHTLIQLNKPAEAVATLRLALALEAGNPGVLEMLARAEYKRGRLSEAEKHFRKALFFAPDRLNTLWNFGTFLAECGRPDEAEPLFRTALALAPDNAAVQTNLAELLRGKGQLLEALALAQSATQLDDNLAPAHCNLGHVYRDLNRLEDARHSYRRALAIDPTLVEAQLLVKPVMSLASTGK